MTWKQEPNRNIAKLQSLDERFVIPVDAEWPNRGISPLVLNGQRFDTCKILQLHFPGKAASAPEPVAEAYIRGDDFVVTYTQPPERTIRPQVYWRSLQFGDLTFGVQVILSTQTDQLASEPESSVVSVFDEADVFSVNAETLLPIERSNVAQRDPDLYAFLIRPHSTPEWSFVQIISPTDLSDSFVRITAEGKLETGFHLFRHDLEKGVIRRGQVCGVFLPRQNDQQSATEICQQFSDWQPPLTT
ncbi:MAG: hypothetical protein R3C28_21750 [Pirellulaceae bacterium]